MSLNRVFGVRKKLMGKYSTLIITLIHVKIQWRFLNGKYSRELYKLRIGENVDKKKKDKWMDKMREQQRKKLWQQTFDGDSTIYSPFIFI